MVDSTRIIGEKQYTAGKVRTVSQTAMCVCVSAIS